MLAGTLFSVLHAFASINLNADQTISGTAINLMAGALVLYISRRFVGTGNIVVNSMTRVDIPVLKDIPVVGKLFLTDTYPTTWFVLAILIVSWFVIERTPFGLRLRSCGEFPEAADAAGISVARIRYAGVLRSGACAGLGGAIYTVTIVMAYLFIYVRDIVIAKSLSGKYQAKADRQNLSSTDRKNV